MIISNKGIRISGLLNIVLGLFGMWTNSKYHTIAFDLHSILFLISSFAFVYGLLVLFKEGEKE